MKFYRNEDSYYVSTHIYKKKRGRVSDPKTREWYLPNMSHREKSGIFGFQTKITMCSSDAKLFFDIILEHKR